MSVLIAASAVVTCLGDDRSTFTALCAGKDGMVPLRCGSPTGLGVSHAYHIDDDDPHWRASRWLADCVRVAVAAAGIDPVGPRVAVLVGTGLRELRAVELWAGGDERPRPDRLHFASAVRSVLPAADVCTISNACSAGGHALALAQDMLELGDADVVVVAAADAMTESMLAMIGRVSDVPTTRLRPFDADRTGVLLGEGAAAVVLVAEPDGSPEPVGGARPAPLARLLATGLSCDATHETAPDVDGICRAIDDAHRRAGRTPDQVDLVVAHGTGTALNDPTEASALRRTFGPTGPGPLVTAIKGSVGHTSGAAALHSLSVAIGALHHRVVPPIVGLAHPLPEAAGLRLVRDAATPAAITVAQVNSFGFGGVNAVSLVEAL